MRGKGIPTTRQSRRSGITPAYAGKSIRLNFYARYCQDHPRVCGEKTFTVRNVEGVEGSPPRMRGKGSATIISQRLGGITPAYAGKSKTGRLHCAVRPDHPRVCGEKHPSQFLRSVLPGSPPRMRGKVISLFSGLYSLRITPAYAGKRYANGGASTPGGDHPRVCGEK